MTTPRETIIAALHARLSALAERLETREQTNEIQRRMLEAAARRPRDRGELVDRLCDGGF